LSANWIALALTPDRFILAALGLPAAASIRISTLRGVGQSLPVVGLFSNDYGWPRFFAFCYGAGIEF